MKKKKENGGAPEGRILKAPITSELRECYIDYSMSVIVGRALPDVRDGLKPVHRRILYAMDGLGLKPSGQFRKSVRIVGDVLGKYHPHGDASVYDAMVRMAQDFSCRYPTVQGHGNFGSVDGDKAAAMRYTEAKMSEAAVDMLRDISMDTVDFTDNFDGSEKEPVVLPSRLPHILVNGSQGIAVGMATSMPPYNLCEAVDAVIMHIDDPDAPPERYRKVMPGPDFPTGGIINGASAVAEAYRTGRGRIRLRARSVIEKGKRGAAEVVFTEIPYMGNKASAVSKLAALVRDGKLDGVSHVRDESDLKSGIRVAVGVKPGYDPEQMREYLYQVSDFETTYGQINLALVPDEKGRLAPKVLSLPEILKAYADHQRDVVLRRTRFELKKAGERLHLLEGLLAALDRIDEVVAVIRGSKTPARAREALVEKIGVDEAQARSILEMRLARLTAMETGSVKSEIRALEEQVARLKRIEESPRALDNQIKRELRALKKKYPDPRRTEILEEPVRAETPEPPSRPAGVAVSAGGYIAVSDGKREPKLPDGDPEIFRADTDTASTLVIVTEQGRALCLPVAKLAEGKRGPVHAANAAGLSPGDRPAGAFATKDFSEEVLIGTSAGLVKRVALSQLETKKRDGIQALSLKDGARAVGTAPGDCDDAVFITRQGMGLRFDPSGVSPQGRAAAGVKGIAGGKDGLEAVLFAPAKRHVCTLAADGTMKATRLSAYKKQKRGGKGLQCVSPKAGGVAAAFVSDTPSGVFLTGDGPVEAPSLPEESRTGKGKAKGELIEE